MGKLGLAFRCFFRVLRDPEFAAFCEKPALPALPKPEEKVDTPAKPTHPEEALALLHLLQGEGRLIDFLQEDIEEFEDEQIGAAVRDIHQSCKKELQKLFTIEPVLSGEEGSEATAAEGFDPTEIKLVGDVRGEPPFQGTLKHHGWKVTKAQFPPTPQNPLILAPAEIEL